ncbi:hypothetical protein SAMN05660836_01263 [Thermodesulforhabdus norvegica]|uniref:Uncharacterized protein n=2 Tax=Thermodesulforhabdus norvegica TaxID=39841 RepID=A0A1I4T703_9BACT|nr:hypothetical protein SAMN05660836_01263 [Thermodesulforhabdus norvegica]
MVNSLAHQSVSRVYENLIKAAGRQVVESSITALFILSGLFFLSLALLKVLRTGNSHFVRSIIVGWFYAMGLFALCGCFLICARIEYIHFFQYGLLAFLAAFLSSSIHGVLWGMTLLGILDEVYNYAFYPFYTSYLDFNDFLLNFAGVMMGILMYCSLFPGKGYYREDFSTRMYGVMFFIASIIFLGLASNRIIMDVKIESKPVTVFVNGAFVFAYNSPSSFWIPLKGGGFFHILHPVEGLILLVLVVTVADQICCRISRSCKAFLTA